MNVTIDPERNEVDALREFAGDLEGKRVLEIGAGYGRLTWRYASNAGEVVGIDPDPERIARAEAHFPQDNLPAGTRVKQKGSTVRMAWSIQERGSRIRQVQFFPRDEMIFDLGTPVTLRHRWHHDQLRFKLLEDRITEPERLYGIMVITLETPGGETTRQSIVNLSLNR